MTNTVRTFVGDGSTRLFAFDFDYIQQAFVKVTVNGDPVGFTFNNSKTVRLNNIPATGTIITVYRDTEREKMVTFSDGSVLLSADMNLADLQIIHIAVEARDQARAGLSLTTDGSFNANGRRISNVGPATSDSDAISRGEVGTYFAPQISTVTTARDQAQSAASQAAGSSASAGASASAANVHRQVAEAEAEKARQLVGSAILTGNMLIFSSYTQATAAVIPGHIDSFFVKDLRFVRDPEGTALVSLDGAKWSPGTDTIHPEHWGATGGEVDASAIFQAMLDWISTDFNRKIVDRFIGARYFQSQLNTVGNVHWDAGAATYYQDHNGRFLSATGNENPTIVALSADYTIGSKSLPVSLPVIPKQGDWVRVVSNALNPNDRSRLTSATKYRVQEFVQVGVGSTENSVSLERPLRFVEGVTADETTFIPAYTVSSNSRATLFDASERFLFKGGRIEQTEGRVGPVSCMVIQSYFRPVVERAVFHKIYGSAVYLTGTLYAHVNKCTMGDIADNELEANQQGYGVADGGDYSLIESCNMGKCRHAYSTIRSALGDDTNLVFSGGNTVGSQVVRCVAVGCTSRAFDTHHGSVGVRFDRCTAEGGLSSGFGGRGIEHVVSGCRTIMSRQGFSCIVEAAGNAGGSDEYATSFLVEDCDFQALEDAFYARNSLVTLWDTTLKSPSSGLFRVVNSLVSLEGRVDMISSSERGSLLLNIPASERWPILVSAGTVSFGGTSRLTIAKNCVLTLDVSAFEALPVSAFSVSVGTTMNVQGTIRVAVPPGTLLFSQPSTRLQVNSMAELHITANSATVDLGNFAGMFVTYASDGSLRREGSMFNGAAGDGRLIKQVDGTMIAYGNKSLGPRNFAGTGTPADPYRTEGQNIEFGATFAATPSITITYRVGDGAPILARNGGVAVGTLSTERATAVRGWSLSPDADSSNCVASYQVIGRWK